MSTFENAGHFSFSPKTFGIPKWKSDSAFGGSKVVEFHIWKIRRKLLIGSRIPGQWNASCTRRVFGNIGCRSTCSTV